MDNPRVAIVILTFGGLELVRGALSAIEKLQYKNRDTIVVNNGSGEKTSKALRVDFPQLEVLDCDVNLGVAGGFNVGLRRVLSGSWAYALLLHHDVEPEPAMLGELVSFAEAHPKASAVGPRIHDFWDRKRVQSAGGALTVGANPIRWRGKRVIDRGQFDSSQEVDCVSSAAMLVRAEALRTVGQLDPQFRHLEDADWCLRAKKLGRPAYYCGKAAAWRLAAKTRPDRPQRELEAGRSTAFLVRRHGSTSGRLFFWAANAIQLVPALFERTVRGRRGPLARIRGALSGLSAALTDPPQAR